MLSMHHFEKIRVLINEGLNNTQIAERLKIHRATVRKYRLSNTKPSYKERAKATKFDPLAGFEDVINTWVASKEDLTGESIFQVIQDLGYKGSLRTLQRRIEILKKKRPKERFFEQSYVPGEQSQFDFKESVTIPFVDGPRVCHLLVATLPASGYFFAKGFGHKTYEAFIDGVHSFFESIGGLTENIRFDNLSPVVSRVLKGRDRIYTQSFTKAIEYYGFGTLPCSPGKGNEKGDCERDIRTFARRIENKIYLISRVFCDFDDFNQWLLDFCFSQVTEAKNTALEHEKSQLKPLPPADESVLCRVGELTASKYGTVRFQDCCYSVPDFMIKQKVKLVVSAFDVKIYQLSPKKELVVTHPRIAKGTSSILLEHSIGSLVRKPQAMIRWAHRKILFPDPELDRYYGYLKKTQPFAAESEFLKSINLIHYVTLSEIVAGVSLIIETQSKSPFYDLKTLVMSNGHFPPSSGDTHVLCQPPINIELSQYDSLIPA
jgi:transposase